MTQPTLNCSFEPTSGWTIDGDIEGFGHGVNGLTIDVDTGNATIMRLSIEGDASLVARVEYDCNLSGTSFWAWVDSESTPHQVLAGVTETTNEDLTTHVSIDTTGVMDSDITMFLTYIGEYSSAQRVLSNLRLYDVDNKILNMVIRIPNFELPRNDWYDELGRIYKDVLIENLNACESQLIELQGLDAYDIQPPDISTIVYPDVTLESDERSIINLRSFINIMGLVNYPLEVNVSATRINKVTYFDSNYAFHSITDSDITDLSDTNKFVYIDTTTNTAKASNDTSVALAGVFIGIYEDGSIKTIHESAPVKLNLMYLLGNMTAYKDSFTRDRDNRGDARSPINNNRSIGMYNGESQSGSHTCDYTDRGC